MTEDEFRALHAGHWGEFEDYTGAAGQPARRREWVFTDPRHPNHRREELRGSKGNPVMLQTETAASEEEKDPGNGNGNQAETVGEVVGGSEPANVGNLDSANVGKDGSYDPFANVGKVLRMPTLAKPQKPFQLNQLEWYKSAGKPPSPAGFYWQASGSKTEQVGKRKKKIVAGWLLIKNGKCQECGERYRPPIAYLKGSAWATLQGESYGRQRAEIKLLLGKSRSKLNDLRCPKCLPRSDGKMPIVGAAL